MLAYTEVDLLEQVYGGDKKQVLISYNCFYYKAILKISQERG